MHFLYMGDNTYKAMKWECETHKDKLFLGRQYVLKPSK
jgi:hypothetical protein